jgi:molecular chaperone DnaK
MLLEAKADEELKARRSELQSLMREVNELMPQLQTATEGSEFSQDAINKATKALAVAKQVLERGELSKVTESIDTLTRTIGLFKGVLQRIGR